MGKSRQEHQFPHEWHVGLVSTILREMYNLDSEQFKEEKPYKEYLTWPAVDDALGKAAYQYVSHLHDSSTLQDTILSSARLPDQFVGTVFQFETRHRDLCYPKIPSHKFLPNSEEEVNISKIMDTCLSDMQHDIQVYSRNGGFSRISRVLKTGRANLMIANDVMLCHGAIREVNPSQMSGLTAFLKKELSVTLEDCTIMQAEGRVPSGVVNQISSLSIGYFVSSKFTCEDFRFNSDGFRLPQYVPLPIEELLKVDPPPKVWPQRWGDCKLEECDQGSIRISALNLTCEAPLEPETFRFIACPKVTAANMLSGNGREYSLRGHFLTYLEKSLKRHLQSVDTEDVEHVLANDRLPELLEARLKLAVEQDFGVFCLENIRTAHYQAQSGEHESHTAESIEWTIAIATHSSVPQLSPRTLMAPATSTAHEKKCQDFLRAISDELTCKMHSLHSADIDPVDWARKTSAVREAVIRDAVKLLKGLNEKQPPDHDPNFSATIGFRYCLLAGRSPGKPEYVETIPNRATTGLSDVSLAWTSSGGGRVERQLDDVKIALWEK